MESPATTGSMGLMDDLVCSLEKPKSIAKRAPWCNADNCYRALFPCPSPSVVTEAVRFCATVSADSATNYPTRAIDACGTGKERYISACSCPATNCPVGKSITRTTTPQQTTQDTVPLVITKTGAEKASLQSEPAVMVTQDQVPETDSVKGVAPTQTVSHGSDGASEEPDIGSTNGSAVGDPTKTQDVFSNDASITHGQVPSQMMSQGQSSTESKSSPLPHSLQSQLTPKSQGQSFESNPSLLLSVSSESGTETKTKPSSKVLRPTKTTPSVPTSISTPTNNGAEGLSVGLVAAIAVGATLIALLLAGIATYCYLKRRTARRVRASTLSGKDAPNHEINASPEWKPPVELPHQTAKISRPELENSLVLQTQHNESVPAPDAHSTLSACSPLTLVEMQGDSACVSPAELFVMPAELPGVYRS
ncbi:hypothetical protein F5B22DRAFT_453009 [Xylaria bambusicola]|uniref:uncharacterized protein n=1 Tax=Xylaria bambusicola TaxID=326684 RepID=UPI00200780A4|nr:uncharacterized protein F5B22DRAFT_453009 [Xylaria bambusicola]KAI0506389.1 hypothetical protein F5B22DRAFT_453009 [Xylaria bambusicola]